MQKRIKEKVEEDKYLGLILSESESADLKEAVRKEKERLAAAEKMKAEARKETEPVLNQWVDYETKLIKILKSHVSTQRLLSVVAAIHCSNLVAVII